MANTGGRGATTVNGEAVRAGRRQRLDATPSPLAKRRQPSSTAVLLVAAFGAFLAFLDSTIVNIAFPAIQRYFHHSDINLRVIDRWPPMAWKVFHDSTSD
jgi:NTE family protein